MYKLFLSILILISTNSYSLELKFCLEKTPNPPFVDLSSAEKPGLIIKKINLIAKEMKLKVNYQQEPWQRCIRLLKEGKIDFLIAAVWSPERDNWGQFPMKNGKLNTELSIWHARFIIFKNSKEDINWNGKEFNRKIVNIGAPPGYKVLDYLKEFNNQYNSHILPERAFKLIKSGRLDGYVLEEKIGFQLLKKYDLDATIHPVATPLIEQELFLPASKIFYQKHKNLVEEFWMKTSKISLN